jgi:hypothetical protein
VIRRIWWRTNAMLAAEARILSDQLTGRSRPAGCPPERHRLGRSGVTPSAVPIPINATPPARTCSAFSRRLIPPVSISGSGLVVARSVASSRK